MKHTVLATMILFSGLAFADAKSDLDKVEADYTACLNSPDGQSNAGMKGCTGTAYQAADKILNKQYQFNVSMFKVKTSDPYEIKYNAEALNRLVKAQRAWITFRDANSDLSGVTMLGGTGESLEIASKAYDMVKARTLELSDLFGSY